MWKLPIFDGPKYDFPIENKGILYAKVWALGCQAALLFHRSSSSDLGYWGYETFKNSDEHWNYQI